MVLWWRCIDQFKKKFQEHCLFKREPGKIIVKLYCIICIHKYTFERLTGSLSLNVHIYIFIAMSRKVAQYIEII